MKTGDGIPASCPLPSDGGRPERGRVLTRLFIKPDGDVIVTDLWEEVREMLGQRGEFDEGD